MIQSYILDTWRRLRDHGGNDTLGLAAYCVYSPVLHRDLENYLRDIRSWHAPPGNSESSPTLHAMGMVPPTRQAWSAKVAMRVLVDSLIEHGALIIHNADTYRLNRAKLEMWVITEALRTDSHDQ